MTLYGHLSETYSIKGNESKFLAECQPGGLAPYCTLKLCMYRPLLAIYKTTIFENGPKNLKNVKRISNELQASIVFIRNVSCIV